MPLILNRFRLVIGLVIGLITAATLAAFAYGYYLEHTARSLLADVKALSLGQSDFADAMRLAQKYDRFRIEGFAIVPASLDPAENVFPQNICNRERCLLEFVIDNQRLAALHFVQGAAFAATIAVLHTKVQFTGINLSGGPSPGVAGGVVWQINPRTEVHPGYYFATPVGKPHLFIKLTPSAPADFRDRAFAINMHCLMAQKGCDEPCDYLPLAWNDWKAELEKTGWSDRLHSAYPHCP